MFVATRALILLFLVLSQPLAASEGACVDQSATDGPAGTSTVTSGCFEEQGSKKDSAKDSSLPEPFNSAEDVCGVQHEWLGVGRVPAFCELLA